MNMLMTIPALAFATTLLAVYVLFRYFSHIALDRPNARSLHGSPIPRTGGMGILAGVALAWGVAGSEPTLPLLLPLVALVGVSFLDDRFGVSWRWRFLVHLAAAAYGLWGMWPTALSYLWLVPAVLALGWLINLYNFMDGSDGLAGGMTLFGFGGYGLAAWLGGDMHLAISAWSVAAAASAFLLFNFPPARIFMGDAGSIPLGFLAGMFGWVGWVRGDWPLWFGLLLFSPFIVDASVTLCARVVRGERVWQAHRNHYYQRLVRMGWGHRQTALWGYCLMALVLVSGLISLRLSSLGQAGIILLWMGVYTLLLHVIDRRWEAFSRGGLHV